jgi:polyferredoxin
MAGEPDDPPPTDAEKLLLIHIIFVAITIVLAVEKAGGRANTETVGIFGLFLLLEAIYWVHWVIVKHR